MTTQDAFVRDLKALGYEAEIQRGHVTFDFEIRNGPRHGETVRLGVMVPDNWPESTPHWIHASPPMDGGNTHRSPIGDRWVKWSRPFPDEPWRRSDKTVQTYLSHVQAVFAEIAVEAPADV